LLTSLSPLHSTHELEYGITVFADVKGLDAETLVRKRRKAFVADTAAERAVRNLKKGQCMLVLRMPQLTNSRWCLFVHGKEPPIPMFSPLEHAV